MGTTESTNPRSPASANGNRAPSSGSGSAPRRDRQHLSKLFEKLPPHAIEAEVSLLGSMLIEPRVIADVIPIMKGADDFYKPANGAVYEAMVHVYDQHASLDIVQLNQYLADRNVLDAVGGVDYLVELANAVPTAAHAVRYGKLVREKAMIRGLIEAAGEILQKAHEEPDDASAIVEWAEQQIFSIAHEAQFNQIESLSDLIRQTMAYLEANEGKQLTGVPTGFSDLDDLTSGLQRGEMIIIAARPSMGKTALALNMIENMAMHGKGVGLFSLEMGKQQLVQRLLAARSGIDSQRLRRNMLRAEDYRALMTACDEMMEAPIFIDDTPGISMHQMRAKARRMVEKHDIKAIIIDYLQLMSTGKRVESRQLEVSEMSRGVKEMARELNLPVICLSQLNRAAEHREGHRPRMSDLRESGSIEQDADVVAMLHREEYYHQNDENWQEQMEQFAAQGESHRDLRGVGELIVAKQRNGPTGTVRLTWVESCTRFRDYTAAQPPAGFDSSPSDRGYDNADPIPFSPGKKSGPIANHRDGGGPDRDEDIDDLPI